MISRRRGWRLALACLAALGVFALGLDRAGGQLAVPGMPAAGPEVQALALAWERTHCFDCEALPETGASEARARARPRR